MGELLTRIIGKEYDDKLIKNLSALLKEEKVTVNDEIWSLAGSQEYEKFELDFKGTCLIIEIETYMGISLTGTAEVINYICNKLKDIE